MVTWNTEFLMVKVFIYISVQTLRLKKNYMTSDIILIVVSMVDYITLVKLNYNMSKWNLK